MVTEEQIQERRDNSALLLVLGEITKSLNIIQAAPKENRNGIHQTLKEIQKCNASIKLKLEKVSNEQSSFIAHNKDRTSTCDKIHDDVEQRLRKSPSGLKCKINEGKIKTVEEKVELIIPTLYKIVGAGLVIAILVPPAVTAIFAFVVKHAVKP